MKENFYIVTAVVPPKSCDCWILPAVIRFSVCEQRVERSGAYDSRLTCHSFTIVVDNATPLLIKR